MIAELPADKVRRAVHARRAYGEEAQQGNKVLQQRVGRELRERASHNRYHREQQHGHEPGPVYRVPRYEPQLPEQHAQHDADDGDAYNPARERSGIAGYELGQRSIERGQQEVQEGVVQPLGQAVDKLGRAVRHVRLRSRTARAALEPGIAFEPEQAAAFHPDAGSYKRNAYQRLRCLNQQHEGGQIHTSGLHRSLMHDVQRDDGAQIYRETCDAHLRSEDGAAHGEHQKCHAQYSGYYNYDEPPLPLELLWIE